MGRVLRGALFGLLFFLFIAVDLVLFGVLPLDSVVVTALPGVGLVLGAILGGIAAGKLKGADTRPAAAPYEPEPVAPAPVDPTPTDVAEPTAAAFVPTHRAPPDGMAAWSSVGPSDPPDARLDPNLPVQVIGHEGQWARIRCENGWEAWVDSSLLIGP